MKQKNQPKAAEQPPAAPQAVNVELSQVTLTLSGRTVATIIEALDNWGPHKVIKPALDEISAQLQPHIEAARKAKLAEGVKQALKQK